MDDEGRRVDDARAARVLVLCGPSGAGKSHLARHLRRAYGWPTMSLDDFYREAGDADLPQSDLGIPDWDHPDSWDGAAAVRALLTLLRTGRVVCPRYDIATSSVIGEHEVRLDAAPVVVAEGIFADRTIAPLREAGLLADAWVVRNRPWLTFARRLTRDLADRRKSPGVLWRRGHQLRRAEPGTVRALVATGARPVTGPEGRRLAARMPQAGAHRPRPTQPHSHLHPQRWVS